jgi:ADP-heptose:LPS heptosyltransferase
MTMQGAESRITLLSFRTFGDYVLKVPFLHEVYRKHPDAQITLLTNTKGGQVYPLLDSRLKVVVVDRGQRMAEILKIVLRLPKADSVYTLDDSRTTLVLALLLRAKHKIGWSQGISRLYGKNGFFEWKSVQPALSLLARFAFRPAKVRLPEDQYDGYVELELLKDDSFAARTDFDQRPLAEFRSRYAWPRAARPEMPYIYCAAQAGWTARQLRNEQWRQILAALLDHFPGHSVLVHGDAALQDVNFNSGGRIVRCPQGSVRQLFETISAADLVIAPDSFALHLASFYGVPAIGYFGPAKPHRFRPTAPGSTALFHQPDCCPCLQARGTEPCLKGLTQCISLASLSASDFLAAAQSALGIQRT